MLERARAGVDALSRWTFKLMEMAGSEHPDGCIRFGGRRKAAGDVLMWDNKSTETAYTFPPSCQRLVSSNDRPVGLDWRSARDPLKLLRIAELATEVVDPRLRVSIAA